MKKGILSLLAGIFGATISAAIVSNVESKKTKKKQILADKHLLIVENMNQWIILKQQGKTLQSYFDEYGYKKIAIYGMSYLGERLYDDLKEIGIEVAYAVDKNASNLYTEVTVYTPDEELPDVDAMIVTATFFFDEIEKMLSVNNSFPIISLEDILYFE